nr:cAMP-specific 3',5'-cyclic phosphodiesterase 4D-like [Odocoileus virginianus texanus]
MKRNTCDLLSRSKSASEETLHSSHEEEDPLKEMEPYLVRRLSCRNIQLPPLAFRQLEQADLKSESENLQRPTTLPLKILPLIAITSADSSGQKFRWLPVGKRILNPAYHLVSVWSWQTLQAWPGMMLLAEMRLCLHLGSSFAFWPADFQDLGRVCEYVKQHFLFKNVL